MSYFYSIFYIAILSSSLFAMNKKNTPDDPKTPLSCNMKSEMWGFHDDKEKGTRDVTYKYADGSKSTYTTYKDSSNNKK